MRKRLITYLLIITCMMLSACAKNSGEPLNAHTEISDQQPENEDNDTADTNMEQNVLSVAEDQASDVSADSNSEVKIVYSKADINTPIADMGWSISCKGLEEYKTLENGDIVDQAPDGKVYLVAYLQFINTTIYDEYINPEYWTSEVDGQPVETSYLFNDPNGYTTMFMHVPSESVAEGFVVWIVDEDWQKLSFNYTGLEYNSHLNVTFDFSKEDLKSPEPYDGEHLDYQAELSKINENNRELVEEHEED